MKEVHFSYSGHPLRAVVWWKDCPYDSLPHLAQVLHVKFYLYQILLGQASLRANSVSEQVELTLKNQYSLALWFAFLKKVNQTDMGLSQICKYNTIEIEPGQELPQTQQTKTKGMRIGRRGTRLKAKRKRKKWSII